MYEGTVVDNCSSRRAGLCSEMFRAIVKPTNRIEGKTDYC